MNMSHPHAGSLQHMAFASSLSSCDDLGQPSSHGGLQMQAALGPDSLFE